MADLNRMRKDAAKKLMEANGTLIGIVNDTFAPIYVQQMLEICGQRLIQLQDLYRPEIYKKLESEPEPAVEPGK